MTVGPSHGLKYYGLKVFMQTIGPGCGQAQEGKWVVQPSPGCFWGWGVLETFLVSIQFVN